MSYHSLRPLASVWHTEAWFAITLTPDVAVGQARATSTICVRSQALDPMGRLPSNRTFCIALVAISWSSGDTTPNSLSRSRSTGAIFSTHCAAFAVLRGLEVVSVSSFYTNAKFSDSQQPQDVRPTVCPTGNQAGEKFSHPDGSSTPSWKLRLRHADPMGFFGGSILRHRVAAITRS